jgi:hypothetical protein
MPHWQLARFHAATARLKLAVAWMSIKLPFHLARFPSQEPYRGALIVAGSLTRTAQATNLVTQAPAPVGGFEIVCDKYNIAGVSVINGTVTPFILVLCCYELD